MYRIRGKFKLKGHQMIVMDGKSGIGKMYEKAVRALHYISKACLEKILRTTQGVCALCRFGFKGDIQ
jgi:hypothetical protein